MIPRPVGRWWLAALAVGLALTAVAGHRAARLTIGSSLVDLLPDGHPAADEYRRFLEVFGGLERVYVVVTATEAPVDAELLVEAAGRVAADLRRLPEVADARAGLDAADQEFLLTEVLPRAPLLLGDGAAAAARRRLDPEAVRQRVRELRRRLRGPAGGLAGRLGAADPFGFGEELPALAAGGAPSMVDPLSGGFLAPGGDAALVVVTPAAGELDSAAGRALAAGIAAAGRRVAEELEVPLALAAAGGPLYAAQDERVLRGDLVRTLAGSAAAVALLLVLFFRGVGLPLAVLLSVAAGVAWTGGLIAVVAGGVSVLGVSFASILLGLGVDYGIHGATRFRELRIAAPADDRGSTMVAVFRDTGPAILASAATTLAGFAVLALADFRPVRELGWVVAAGIAAILAASLAVGAPAVVVLPRLFGERSRRGWAWRWVGAGVRRSVAAARRRPWAVVAVAAVATAAAAPGIARLRVDPDLSALRPADHPARVAERLLAERFGLGLDTATVVLGAPDLDAALAAAARVERALGEELGPGAEIVSPARWLTPAEPAAAALAPFRGAPAEAALAALDDELAAQGFARRPFEPAIRVMAALARGEAPPPVPPERWPRWLDELVRVEHGRVWAAVRVRTPTREWPDGPPAAVLAAVGAAAPGAAVASAPRLGAEIRRLVLADFSRLVGWGAAVVAAVVLLSFRGRPRPALLALVPVTLGCVWTFGLAGLVGLGIDPFSIVVAPLLLGIGIDDGLHALHGARAHGGIAEALGGVGRAMTLTTLTTCAGFGSLAASRVPALARGGVLVAVGVALCLAATLWVLPAVEALTTREGRVRSDRMPRQGER